MVESVSEKAIAGKRTRNGVDEYYRVLTLDVKNTFNKADWQKIMSAIQKNPETSSIPDFEDVVEAIEIPTFNQTHWTSISDAIARQQDPKVVKITGAADGIALEVIKRHLSDVETASNAEVVLVQDWLDAIGLQMAEKKTDVVLKSRIKKVEQERVKEGNLLLQTKPEIGYLGLLLNTKLKFKHDLQYADQHLPKKQAALLRANASTVSNVKNLKKMMLVMNVSTAALLYPSNSKRDSALNEKRLKLIVETKYNVERQLLSGKDESKGDKKALKEDGDEDISDYVDLVLVDERKRWKMRRTESLPGVNDEPVGQLE
ncbi:uncharacterized protein LOC118737371 [Rhagoletis pomonella]|uniref:uncharacterized protein LOC118737371 n=1 Tax=Rhagoletis pomonella TaxID=28610 RepID=UPI001780F1C7|nr:uncharacterized protein LOC118737371 [Rhagoletis pomonella]